MNLLFFNRYPVVDHFVSEIIAFKCERIKIIRTIPDLHKETHSGQYQTLLMNVDDRLDETAYIKELVLIHKKKMRIIIFGQYASQAPKLVKAGVNIFLGDDSQERDFLTALA
ncbi:hypothetical protein [Dyadobacter sp. 32]|uniref:hypothetical protein n=1 Tax=Dyadobacter sp. 32 TaxID=538966 RepID=UPI0011EC133A